MSETRILLAIPHREMNETFFNDALYAQLETLGEVDRISGSEPLTEDEWVEIIEPYEIVLTGWGQVRFTERIMARAKNLKLIGHCGGSVAPYVGSEVYGRGVRVVSGNDVFAESVAEACLAYALAALRKIPHYDREMKAGRWRMALDNEGLFNKRIGLVGYGAIARFFVGMLEAFDVTVQAYDPFVDPAEMEALGVQSSDLDSVFMDSDIVSLHLPRNPSTEGMITEAHLRSMPEGALFINTARGSIVDEAALADVLHEGKLRAVLDVFQQEPLAEDSPLRTAPNTILIPHMAGPTLDRRPSTSAAVIADVGRYLDRKTLRHEISEQKAAQMTR